MAQTKLQPESPIRWHVLLVGIDAYPGAPLYGCVNDSERIARLLMDQVGVPTAAVRQLTAPHAVPDSSQGMPTLARLRQELERLTGDEVQPGDRVFIYYAGHGTRVEAQSEGKTFSREALVPLDYLDASGAPQLLFDLELNGLLARISARTRDVTIILDCCCSAGITRGVERLSQARARFLSFERPLTFPRALLEPRSPGHHGLVHSRAGLEAVQAVTACMADESALEAGTASGPPGGIFTAAFQSVIAELAPEGLTQLLWSDVWARLVERVSSRGSAQTPWLFGHFERPVFGGAWTRRDVGFRATQQGDVVQVHAGSLVGVVPGTELAVYGDQPPRFPELGSTEDLAARLALVQVTSANLTRATATFKGAAVPLPPGARLRISRPGEEQRVAVSLGEVPQAMRDALANSPLLRLVEGETAAEARIEQATPGELVLRDATFSTAGQGALELARGPADDSGLWTALLHHFARYVVPERIARRCAELPGALTLRLLDCDTGMAVAGFSAQDPRLEEVSPDPHCRYRLRTGGKFAIAVENASSEPLFTTVLNRTASGRVEPLGFARVPPHGWHVLWQEDQLGVPFEAWLPEDRSESIDRLVAIGTTERGVDLRMLEVAESFAEVAAQHRETGQRELLRPRRGPVHRWTSNTVSVRVAR